MTEAIRSVPEADRGPQAGGPLGVVDATGFFCQLEGGEDCDPVGTEAQSENQAMTLSELSVR